MVWVQTQNNSVPNWIPKKEDAFSQEDEEMRQGEEEVMCIVGNGIHIFRKGKQTTEEEGIAMGWGPKDIIVLQNKEIIKLKIKDEEQNVAISYNCC